MELNQKNSAKNIKWHNLTIDRNKLEKMRGHKGMVIWFTGLSGSGKSTLANAVNEVLHLDSFSTYVLDGDNIRHGLLAIQILSLFDEALRVKMKKFRENLHTQVRTKNSKLSALGADKYLKTD